MPRPRRRRASARRDAAWSRRHGTRPVRRRRARVRASAARPRAATEDATTTEKLAALAPGRLSTLLAEGLRGHHLLFDPDEIRAAFEAPDEIVSRDEANAVGEALLAMCRDPIPAARFAVDALAPTARVALIRLYFRLLDRARGAEQPRH